MASPKITLVIVVEKNDLELFKQTAKGINNFLHGITNILIYVEDSALNNFKDVSFVFPCTYIPIPFFGNEIPQKMIYRMCSHLDVTTDYIMFMECGTILTKKVIIKNFFVENKPLLLRREIPETDRKILAYYKANDFLSAECKYDFSQIAENTIQPTIYYRSSLEEAEKEFVDIHGKSYAQFYIDSLHPLSKKTEFTRLLQIIFDHNHTGLYSYYFDTDKYSIKSINEMMKKKPYLYFQQTKEQNNVQTAVHKRKKISPLIGKSKIPSSELIKISDDERKKSAVVEEIKIPCISTIKSSPGEEKIPLTGEKKTPSTEEKKTALPVEEKSISLSADEKKSISLSAIYILNRENLNYLNYHFQYFNILVSGIDEIIIYVNEEDEELGRSLIYSEVVPHRVICVKNVNKLNKSVLEEYLRLICYKNTKTSYLLFFDTNTVIRDAINLKDLIIKSKPLLGSSNVSPKEDKTAIIKMVQATPSMNLSMNPHIYKTSTLLNADVFFTENHKKNYRDYCIENNASEADKFISAYGYLSYYIWLKEQSNYYVTNMYTDPLLIKVNRIIEVTNIWIENPNPILPEVPSLTNEEILQAKKNLLVPYKVYANNNELKFLSISGTSIPEIPYDGIINIGDEEKSSFASEFIQKINVPNYSTFKESLYEIIQSIKSHSQQSSMINDNNKRNLLLRTNKIEELLHIPDLMLNQCLALILRGLSQDFDCLDLLTKLNTSFCPISITNNPKEVVYLRRDSIFTFDISETNIKFTQRQLILLQKIDKFIMFGSCSAPSGTITIQTNSDTAPRYHVISDSQYADRFNVTTEKIGTKTYSVTVTRLDIHSGWEQIVYLRERNHSNN